MNIRIALDEALHMNRMSVKDLADKMGVSVQTIYKSYRYSANPTCETIVKTSAALNMSPSEFIALGEDAA